MNRFLSEDTGAITADWIVLFAAATGLAAVVVLSIDTSVNGLGSKVGSAVSDVTVPMIILPGTTVEIPEDDPILTLDGPITDGWHEDGCLYENGQMIACT